MSWWGGGLISDWPGWRAGATRCTPSPCGPGSWPPSPGLEPWAILISSCSARARYSAVTPNRADATCLIRASGRCAAGPRLGPVPGGILAALAGVRGTADALDPEGQRPVRLRATARPTLIADTTNRRAIADAGSTVADRRGRRRAGAPAASRRGRRPADGRARRDTAGRAPTAIDVRRAAVGPTTRLDRVRDRRRVQVALAVGAVAGQPDSRAAAPRRSTPACARAASSRRSCTAARSRRTRAGPASRRGREARLDHRRRQLQRLEQLRRRRTRPSR